MNKAERILIVGPSWVGDMVMSQALLKAIKAQTPFATLDVLAPEWSRSLTERMPEVAQSLSIPVKRGELKLRTRYQFAKQLRDKYQRCFVLPNSFKSALIPFWAKIPRRLGWRGEWRYGLLNHLTVLDKERYPKMVARYVALAGEEYDPRFRPRLVVKEQHVQAALACHALHTDLPILILCPGAEFGPSKRWPESYYGELANAYLKKGWQVWILGSEKDSEVVNTIQQLTQQQSVDLTGRTTLSEAIDLMSLARFVLTNDSGLMHIAAALDKPLIALYGSTDPYFTPPLSKKARIVQEKIGCSPCFKRQCPLMHHACMKGLTVEKVIHAIDVDLQ